MSEAGEFDVVTVIESEAPDRSVVAAFSDRGWSASLFILAVVVARC